MMRRSPHAGKSVRTMVDRGPPLSPSRHCRGRNPPAPSPHMAFGGADSRTALRNPPLGLPGRCVGQPRPITEPGHRGNQGAGRDTGVEGDPGAGLGVGHFGRARARDLLQRVLDVGGTGLANHAGDVELWHQGGCVRNP